MINKNFWEKFDDYTFTLVMIQLAAIGMLTFILLLQVMKK